MSRAMGSVLVQPQRVRRARRSSPSVSLLTDFAVLMTRLATDAKTGGRIGTIARDAVNASFERIVAERATSLPQAAPRLARRLGDLLRAVTGVSASVRIEAPADALGIAHGVLDHFAIGLEGVSAAKVRPHIVALIDIIEKDLGFSLAKAEAELWSIVDDVIARLEAEPAEADARARENRLETACILSRLRRLLRGRVQLPRLDPDRIAGLIASLLARLRAPEVAARLRCIANALEAGARTGQSVSELVPIGTFAEFRSLGAAAAAAAAGESFCWYATWLLGAEVVINAERTEIRKGGKVVHTGTNLTLKDIPEFKAGHDPHYTFGKTLDEEALETIAFVSAISADALIVLLHAISLEEGDFASNAFNLAFPLVYDIGKIHTRRMLMPLWAEDWIIPAAITIPASLEGIHTEAKAGFAALMWLTLLLPDVGEERLYRFYGKSLRNALLSLLTLVNHKEPATGVRPENRNAVAGLADLTGFLHAMLLVLAVPRKDYGLLNTQTDPDEFNFLLVFWWWLGLSTINALVSRVLGGLLAWAFAGAAAPKAWFTERWWALFEHWFWHIAFLYWHMDGDTGGGTYNPVDGQPEYNGYPDRETSPYTLPYKSGLSCYVGQANQGAFSHNFLNGNQVYCYDFSLDQGEVVLAARPGTVVDWFDWVPDDRNESTTPPAAPDPDALPSTTMTQSNTKNFIIIRHDLPDDYDPAADDPADPVDNLAADEFHPHDRIAGTDGAGKPNLDRTYATYLHGRFESVREVFKAQGIEKADIIGTRVGRGQPIMRCGNTGKSFHNHLHMAARPGPNVGLSTDVTASGMRDEIPFVFRDVENFIGRDGVPGKLNWYTGTVGAKPDID